MQPFHRAATLYFAVTFIAQNQFAARTVMSDEGPWPPYHCRLGSNGHM